MTQNDFNKILLSAVDEGLCLLGDSSKQAILFHLEDSFQLKEENIPSNLTEFKKALDSIFGPGATYLEKVIVKRLHEKLGLRFEEGKNADFLEYVEAAKSRIHIMEGEITLEKHQLFIEGGRLGGGDANSHPGSAESSWSPPGSEQQRRMEVK